MIEFTPARDGEAKTACLGDIEGAEEAEKITLNGKNMPLSTVLKNGDSIMIKLPPRRVEEVKEDGIDGSAAENKGVDENAHGVETENEYSPETLDAENAQTTAKETEIETEVVSPQDVQTTVKEAETEAENLQDVQATVKEAEAENAQNTEKRTEERPDEGLLKTETEEADAQEMMEERLYFSLNGSSLYLPKKEDGRPYYLMDLIQYSGIDLNAPKGRVRLQVNGEEGRFQQVLREGDNVLIREEEY